MNLHEFQAKHLLAERGVSIPRGYVARSGAEARAAIGRLGGDAWVIKAQVHAGGRGKAGGVKVLNNEDEAADFADSLLGQRLVTKQTDAAGQPIEAVMIEEGLAIERELYLSMLIDRARQRVVCIASAAGGMDIEEVAATAPEQIITIEVHPSAGLQPYQGRQVGFALGLDKRQVGELTAMLQSFYQLFIERDLSLIEINPLVVDSAGSLICLDAKITVDDNAIEVGKQQQLAAMRDLSQEDATEVRAAEHQLNYITLDGNIGCMVNGAGLAMATMDIIQVYGGAPANFLDVGGGTSAAKVTEAFKIILSSPRVEGILVNIFGGIVRCDMIAEGIIAAVREVEINVPVVVRLEGTNVEEGKQLLADSGLDLIPAADLAYAAERVVAAVEQRRP
ncbi:succinyl-CoA ligase [ADP-forming [Halorhodospira halochloris]|uniref:Succinate--CoA ligase [ADP-forming] subunit beta n=1 Tax=Halorhodospira halochloris TaxID=1052 RepID=A0A110B4P1_HALHR|nr:ADP-forming succinate--CoA ligase subunit beta [Halorhodospira halochloris]MBK1652311.1 succinate--CoA ligase subunit beta [Halorhodospira halochloris]BAU56892.1 succinyl-CoA ligase [ADP-forming [Halorhodospira halochloris]